MPTEINADVWRAILSFVRNPTPAPLSNPPRSELQQPGLCAASRVSKVFRSICESFLYTHISIVTSDLPLLIRDIQTPSKKRLLSQTRSLRIEYTPKGRSPTYLGLLAQRGSWERCGMISKAERDAAMFSDCNEEVEDLLPCLKRLVELGLPAVFPRLETIAVAPTSRWDPRLWFRCRHEFQQHYPRHKTTANQCIMHFELLQLSASTQLKHVCIRDGGGPLAFGMLSYSDKAVNPAGRTVHFTASDTYMPVSTDGMGVRWVSDDGPDVPWVELAHLVGVNLSSYHKMPQVKDSPKAINLEIYGSTKHFGVMPSIPSSWDIEGDGFACGVLEMPMRHDVRGPELSAETQRIMAAEMGERGQEYLRKHRGPQDTVKWYPSALIPICQACGSGCPE